MSIINAFENEFSAVNRLISSSILGFVNEKDRVIREAIREAGLDPDDTEMLKTQMTLVIRDGDPFEHLYYLYGSGVKRRIISIERFNTPRIEMQAWDELPKILFETRYY